MASVLVDYENVVGKCGLKGVEHLNSEDRLYLFYSGVCDTMRTEYMESIKSSGCDFNICKLRNPRKNALDYYIASQCGILCQQGETQIVIVSGDNGFKSVSDFVDINYGKRINVICAKNVEDGLLRLQGGSERQKKLLARSKMVDISLEHAKYSTERRMKERLRMAFKDTPYEDMISEIFQYTEDNINSNPAELYRGSLHLFGREAGTGIYHILRTVVNS